MKNVIRIIPRLDVKGPNLVKGVHLEGLRVLGKPEDFATRYYQQGADELIYMDVVASLYGRDNLKDIVAKAAQNIFIPLTAGGGVRTIDDIKQLLRVGADKIAINTAAIANPSIIKEGARRFGSQCIIVSIEAKRMPGGQYVCFTDNGREPTGKDAYQWAKEVVDLGAGEILLTSIDREGTGTGYDLELVRTMADMLPIPVIACGGAGSLTSIVQVVKEGRADAVCAASLFHYHRLQEMSLQEEHFSQEGNIEYIKQSRGSLNFISGRIQKCDVATVKGALVEAGIACRTMGEAEAAELLERQVTL